MDSTGHASVTHPDEVDWYYLDDGVQVGPLSERSLLEAARQNRISPTTLIWQQGFSHWKEAATIPMVAVNLGSSGSPELGIFLSAGNATEDGATSSANEGTPAGVELGDAVNEDEAAEPQLDLQQVREILHRASRPPPERTSTARSSRPPQERSIPPASVSTNPPRPERMRKMVNVLRLVPFAAIPLGIGIAGVVFMTRAARRPVSRPTAVVAQSSQSSRLAVPPGASARRSVNQASPPRTTPANVATPQSNANENVPSATDLASVTSGPLDVQLLNAKLQRALPMFDEQCWNKLRVRVPNVPSNPSIRVEMSIDRDGNVYAIDATKSPRGYWGVGPCIIGRMRGWKFPRAEGGSRASVTVARIHD